MSNILNIQYPPAKCPFKAIKGKHYFQTIFFSPVLFQFQGSRVEGNPKITAVQQNDQWLGWEKIIIIIITTKCSYFTRNHQSESLVSSLKWPLCNSDSPSPLVSSLISTSYSSDFVQNNYSWWSWWWIYINFPALNKDSCLLMHCAHILQAIDAVRLFLTWSHLKLFCTDWIKTLTSDTLQARIDDFNESSPLKVLHWVPISILWCSEFENQSKKQLHNLNSWCIAYIVVVLCCCFYFRH